MANPFSSPFTTEASSGVKESNSGKPAGNQSADDIESFLNEDDDKEEVKIPKIEDDDDEEEVKDDSKKKAKKDEDEDDEEESDDVKLKEEDDDEDDDKKEKLDLKEDEEDKLDVAPRKKDIAAKYPNFFKEFPFFDKMMFRDKAYSEMFGSFDEAKEIYNKVERLNEFETQLLSGDTGDVLKTVKATDPKAFDKIVDNYLKSLHDVDPDAYKDVTENFAKQIILGMADQARRKNDKELDKAAQLLHEFLFDTDKWTDVKVRAKEEKSDEAAKIEKERTDLMRERFEIARDGLTVKVDNVLKATIGDYIDPRGLMTAYEKRNAITETLDRLHKKVAGDTAFRKNLDRLWRSAFSDKFTENSLNGIKKSYLGKAKGLLSSTIKEVRAEVLKDNRSRGKEKQEQEETLRSESPKKNVNAGRPHQQTIKANDRQPGESVEEYLMRD